ncbi:curlin [Salinarimonas sp. NSM]|uniref:curlin n=1 Tax=Salinarimonas sp. NSM TaxID=3458003 RepID=UPI0040355F3D
MTRTPITRTRRTLAAAGFLAAALAGGPALAEGALSITANPQGDAGRLLAAGLAIYGIAADIDANGRITQRGRDNAAGLLQHGRGHLGIVHQQGDGHVGTLEQSGAGNSYGLFQFGRGARAAVRQHGVGRSGVTVQFGF